MSEGVLAHEPAFEDLTARARIRDAALRLFTERGVSIREIARVAGVSSGLVRHHFGSKEALRQACDAYALERLLAIKERAVAGELAHPGFLPAVHPTQLGADRSNGHSEMVGWLGVRVGERQIACGSPRLIRVWRLNLRRPGNADNVAGTGMISERTLMADTRIRLARVVRGLSMIVWGCRHRHW